jgi:hypothetical protein
MLLFGEMNGLHLGNWEREIGEFRGLFAPNSKTRGILRGFGEFWGKSGEFWYLHWGRFNFENLIDQLFWTFQHRRNSFHHVKFSLSTERRHHFNDRKTVFELFLRSIVDRFARNRFQHFEISSFAFNIGDKSFLCGRTATCLLSRRALHLIEDDENEMRLRSPTISAERSFYHCFVNCSTFWKVRSFASPPQTSFFLKICVPNLTLQNWTRFVLLQTTSTTSTDSSPSRAALALHWTATSFHKWQSSTVQSTI